MDLSMLVPESDCCILLHIVAYAAYVAYCFICGMVDNVRRLSALNSSTIPRQVLFLPALLAADDSGQLSVVRLLLNEQVAGSFGSRL